MIWIAVILVPGLVGVFVLWRWGARWGSTSRERSSELPGDEYLEGQRSARVVMTRSISISAPPEQVWPWIAQLGRGAGWYSIDWLDNGRRVSARHIVSWIPGPRFGDATAIGYLRHVDTGRALAWWVGGVWFFGAEARLVTYYGLEAEGRGTRLISRMSADAVGPFARVALVVFQLVDSIMACSQLRNIRRRVDRAGTRGENRRGPETGARDQYQYYEVRYCTGESAGIPGKEEASRWQRAAVEDGIVPDPRGRPSAGEET